LKSLRTTWRAVGWLAAVLLLVAPSLLLAQENNRVAVVVRLADGQIESRCVYFDEPHISGFEALTRTGLEVDSQAMGMGSLVCRIEGQGCPGNDCLCQCKGGPDCVYWSYWHLVDDRWQYATIGAAAYQLTNGAVDGWSWGPGSVSAAAEPPPLSFEQVCAGELTVSTTNPLTGPPLATTEKDAPAVLPYLAFGLILVVMAGLFIVRRRQGEQ
jgi:hypothetical protein